MSKKLIWLLLFPFLALADGNSNSWQSFQPYSTAGWNSRQGGIQYGYPSCFNCDIENDVTFQLLFDEASGNITDEIGSVVLTAAGTPQYSQVLNAPHNLLDPCINGNDSADRFATDSSQAALSPGTGDFMFELWVTMTDTAFGVFFSTTTITTERGWYVAATQSTPVLTMFTRSENDLNTSTNYAGCGSIADGTAHKLAFIHERDVGTEAFADGQSCGTGSAQPSSRTITAHRAYTHNYSASQSAGNFLAFQACEMRFSKNVSNRSSGG